MQIGMHETSKKRALLEAKEEIHRIRIENERENRERRTEIQKQERRLLHKEESIDRKLESLEKKEDSLDRKSKELDQREGLIEELYSKQVEELERLSGLTSDEAKELLLNDIKKK